MKKQQQCNAVEHTVSEDGESCLCGYFTHGTKKQELAVLRARRDALQAVQRYWFNLSISVPRLQQSPPPVKQFIAEQVAQLDAAIKGLEDETSK